MKLIDADKLSADMYHEAFVKDSDMQKWDSGCWIRYKMFENVLKAQPAAQPDTTTDGSNVVKTGKNDGDRTSGDCISRTRSVDALRDYLVEKRCPDDGTLTCRLIENEVINKLPSVQPDIIRCKDCVYQTESWSGIKYCEAHGDHIGKDYDYCSNARRKENGH